MADAPLSELAAKLVVEGSLDVIAGKTAPGQFPMQGGLRLSETRRTELGRPPGGSTLYYAAGERDPSGKNGVFMDFQDATTTVWFHGADATVAMQQLEKALKTAYPKTAQREDKAHASKKGTRLRSYDVPLGDGRAAALDVAYPAPKSSADDFVVRIHAFAKGGKKH